MIFNSSKSYLNPQTQQIMDPRAAPFAAKNINSH